MEHASIFAAMPNTVAVVVTHARTKKSVVMENAYDPALQISLHFVKKGVWTPTSTFCILETAIQHAKEDKPVTMVVVIVL